MNLSIVPVLRRPRSRVVHHHSKRRRRCQGGCTGVSAAGHKAAEQLPPGLGSTGTSSQKESRAEIMHALSSGGQDAWRFSGSAVYQLYAVAVADASHLLPSGTRPLSLFGYTLGGIFLASYATSPCGPYEELAVLPATVWTARPPRLGAWGTAMVVNSDAAVSNGRDVFGLPTLRGTISPLLDKSTAAPPADAGYQVTSVTSEQSVALDLSEAAPWLVLRLPWRLPLPSFAGLLGPREPLLHYNIWMTSAVEVRRPLQVSVDGEVGEELRGLAPVLAGRPLCALVFKDMDMLADTPAECT
eukprot:jgi/Tetstr1/466218/TSEL_010776.t1